MEEINRVNIFLVDFGFWCSDFDGDYYSIEYKNNFDVLCETIFSKADMERLELKHNKKKKTMEKSKLPTKLVFITIQDFKRRFTDIEKLQLFISKSDYLYENRIWAIESGKNTVQSECNYHIHMLCRIKNSKKHKQQLNALWTRLFPDSSLNEKDYYLCKRHTESPNMPTYDDWIEEKIDYFKNELKGSHSNSFPSLVGGLD